MSNPGIQVAETIQTASINRAPSPHHDINPSTAASQKEPVTLSKLPGDISASDSDEIPEYILHDRPRRAKLPPLPDLRFEQSYLKSIEGRDRLGIAWVTLRDQVVLPLVQGTIWTLALQGWRVWNRGANYSGRTAGSRIRRWWYGVNNWSIPESTKDDKLAAEISEYYQSQFSTSGGD